MNFAWYGHLRFKEQALWKVILISWGIAFFEYLIIIPTNRYGSQSFSVFQLKIMQEIVTIVVFVFIAVLYFKESIKWNYIAGFICIIAAAFFVFYKWE
jgi:uncharacterized protein (DUF486 family)